MHKGVEKAQKCEYRHYIAFKKARWTVFDEFHNGIIKPFLKT